MFKMLGQWRERRRYRAMYYQLSTLSDQTLNDVGLKRDDVETLRRGKSPVAADRTKLDRRS